MSPYDCCERDIMIVVVGSDLEANAFVVENFSDDWS